MTCQAHEEKKRCLDESITEGNQVATNIFNGKHNFYRNTWCVSVAQEEQSALPAGIINSHEDSSDDDDVCGEQREIAKEVQELRAAEQWVKHEGWDARAEGQALSLSSGGEIDLGRPRSLTWETNPCNVFESVPSQRECVVKWTESCLRLRDSQFTKEDWVWWCEHDLDRGHLNAEQKDYFNNEAVWLCARREDVGSHNGRKLAKMAEEGQLLIHKINAVHSGHKNARKQPSEVFEGLRSVVHLVRGCKVMLTCNIACRYGLANGTRGKLVGVVYGPAGIGSFPEAIVVDVPDYCGPAFYPDEPKWVPILPKTSVKQSTRMTRTQFPIVAGFAMTINKAQGLTIKEGVVIHLVGGRSFRPAAKHGLLFVAWTRSESFAMTAFKNLPPWSDFLKGKRADMLRTRREFTKQQNSRL